MHTIEHTDLILDLAPHGKGFITESELLEMLPHGSGIDCKWRFEPIGGGVDCHNSFHLMDENGYYNGFADFTVRIFHHKKDVLNPLRGPCAGQTQVVHRKGDVDFKLITRGSKWKRNCAFGVDDYLHDTISFSLERILTKRHEIIASEETALRAAGLHESQR